MFSQRQSTEQQLEHIADYAQPAKWGRYGLGFFFVLFLLWAFTMPIDSGVPAQGVIGIESKRQSVQHQQGGVIKRLQVTEGSRVAKGQVLIELDNTQIVADLARATHELTQFSAKNARLLAERQHLTSIDFTIQPILANLQDQTVQAAIHTQSAFFNARANALHLESQVVSERIKSKKLEIKRQQSLVLGRQQQAKLLTTEIASHRALLTQQYVSQERLFELERELSDVEIGQTQGQLAISQAQADIAELESQNLLQSAQFQRDVENEMADVQQQIVILEQQRLSLTDQLEHTQIKAPAAGIVVGQIVHTQGGVISAGQVLMDIVPDENAIVVDAKVAPHLIEHVQRGQLAHVRILALDTLNPVVEGVVATISADQLSNPNTGEAYFTVRLYINKQSLATLKYKRISAGMPVEVLFNTGERTFFRYLAEPLLKTFFFALRE